MARTSRGTATGAALHLRANLADRPQQVATEPGDRVIHATKGAGPDPVLPAFGVVFSISEPEYTA